MPKNVILVATLMALVGVAPLLAGCNTTSGAGQDLSQAGKAIEKSADKHAP
jgi:predicted small secreted protein